MKEFSYEEIKASTKNFSLDRLVGKGSHGRVYKGILKGGKAVAVKIPTKDLESKLEKEIQILSSIGNHPNLVHLVGTCRDSNRNPIMVTEFMPHGSLYDLVHLHAPSWPHRMMAALQVAHAVHMLHSAEHAVIHRDIKSANVLLDSSWNAKLADFSLAVSPHRSCMVPAAGTFGYLDPRYEESGNLGPENDVFSFGVLLLEIFSSRKVMEFDSDVVSIVSWAVPMIREGRVVDICDKRVELSEGMERGVGRVLRVAARCISRKEERRPAMIEVVGELREALEGGFLSGWGSLKSKISRRVCKYVRAWRRCKKKRLTMKKIVCKDHLIRYEED